MSDIEKHRLMRDLKRLARYVSRKRLAQFIGLAGFMLVGAVAEMATLAAVVPFLSLLLGASTISCSLPGPFCDIGLRDIAFVLCLAAVVAALIRSLLSWSTHRYTAAIGIDISTKLYSRIFDYSSKYK